MTIGTIIKRAVKRLELEGKLLTPDAYAETFCKEAKKAGAQVEDCQKVDKFTKSLNKDFQKELANFRIRTMNELARFLISKLNRTNPTTCTDILDAQTKLTKRVLQVIEVLHNKEAANLSKKSISLLDNTPTASQLEQFRQLWVNFITTYDDTFLQELNVLGKIDSTNLKKSVENLNLNLSELSLNATNMDLSKIASLLVSSFVPSIASSVNDQIANLSQKIKNNPQLLDSVSIESEIKNTISLRIALDKESVKEMVESLDGVLDKLSLRLIKMIESSDSSTVDIQKIKHELELYNEDTTSSFKVAHKKLYTIAVALEKNTQMMSNDLKTHSNEVSRMGKKLQQMEKELAAVKKESKEDFLTKLYNKRALDELMAMKEAEFSRYGHNFSVVMFDLDLFKLVNDDFGHEAGDAVLSAFAKILKKECRTVDIVGRFGGEEFLAILSTTDSKGGFIFAEKVRKHVQKSRFMYQGKRIKVTVSGGVSDRKKHVSLQATLNSADEYLYKAKKDGRNQIAYKK
ncbi:MAG: GGDEF domain-containing protein [Sulfurimonas sp.]